MLTLVLIVISAALLFEFINGFHDTANSIATVVSTKVLNPRQAVMLAAFCNLLGALAGTAVAKTISSGLVDAQVVTLPTILCALMGGIIWNLITWWYGLPSSSSHALIGGLCGASVAAAGDRWSVIHWWLQNPKTGKTEGLIPKVVIPMFVSPMVGILFGALIMLILMAALRKVRPVKINAVFGKLQICSAAWMGFSHGTNDAQKTMGIITLTLFTATADGVFHGVPSWAHFLELSTKDVPAWVKVICAIIMALGTAMGGWRIIRTLGHKMVKLQPIHGFAAETGAASIIGIASHWGIPLSTTHVITTSIMGVGATKRLNAVRWSVVERILWAWVLTLPVTFLLGWGLLKLVFSLGLHP